MLCGARGGRSFFEALDRQGTDSKSIRFCRVADMGAALWPASGWGVLSP